MSIQKNFSQQRMVMLNMFRMMVIISLLMPNGIGLARSSVNGQAGVTLDTQKASVSMQAMKSMGTEAGLQTATNSNKAISREKKKMAGISSDKPKNNPSTASDSWVTASGKKMASESMNGDRDNPGLSSENQLADSLNSQIVSGTTLLDQLICSPESNLEGTSGNSCVLRSGTNKDTSGTVENGGAIKLAGDIASGTAVTLTENNNLPPIIRNPDVTELSTTHNSGQDNQNKNLNANGSSNQTSPGFANNSIDDQNEVLVASGSSNQTRPVIAYNSIDNQYLIVWSDDSDGGSLHGAIKDSNGEDIITDTLIVQASEGVPFEPEIEFNPQDDSYMIIWSEATGFWITWNVSTIEFSMPGYNLYALPLSSDGTPLATVPTLITDELTFYNVGGLRDDRRAYDIAYNSTSNEYGVVWEQNPGALIGIMANPHSVIVRRLSAAGELLGSQVNESQGIVSSIQITYGSASNEYLVTWDQYPDYIFHGYDLFVQRLNAGTLMSLGISNITSLGSTANTAAWQWSASLAYIESTDQYLVTWNDTRYGMNRTFYWGDVYGQFIQAGTGTFMGPNFSILDEGELVTQGSIAYNPKIDMIFVTGIMSTDQLVGRILSNTGEMVSGQLHLSSLWMAYPAYPQTVTDNNVSGYPCGWLLTYGVWNGQDIDIYAQYQRCLATVPEFSVRSSGNWDGCFGCVYDQSQGHLGGPINTLTGGYDYSVEDLSIPTTAGPLNFRRFYSSMASDFSSSGLGTGWTHNLDSRLIFPDSPGGTEGMVLFKAHTTNEYVFYIESDGTYSPSPGLFASLTKIVNGSVTTYVIKNKAQEAYTFDEDGRLILYTDQDGHSLNYGYNESGLIEEVEDSTGMRHLTLSYDGQDRLLAVSDQNQREVSYSYDSETGDLSHVTDVFGHEWTYQYDPNHPHLLAAVIDPADKIVERTEYDSQGRAVRQYNGQENITVELSYNTDGTTTIASGGITETHIYDARNTLVNTSNILGVASAKTYDSQFNPSQVSDALENTTQLTWGSNGTNLTRVEDAAGGITSMDYDSLNNLMAITDTLGNVSTFVYSGTLLLRSTDALGNSTIYTYTTSADVPEAVGLLKAVEDPLGRVTRYTYDEFGQRTAITDSLNRTTYYAYDDLGWLYKITYPTGLEDQTCYNAGGQVVRTASNVETGVDACVSNYPETITSSLTQVNDTIYDLSGNTIGSISWSYDQGTVISQTTRTYYDDANRPVTVVQNLSPDWGVTNEEKPEPGYLDPLHNLRSDTVYDAAGNVIASVQWSIEGSSTLTQTTRTYYDASGRPWMVVQNLTGQSIQEDTPPEYDPDHPDQNVRSETVYDAAGNVVQSIDNGGRVTYTCYDSLNRAVKMVQNPTVSDPCVDYTPSSQPDEDIIQKTVFDSAGNAIATIDPAGRITRTYYDELNRPEYVVQNLANWSIETSTPPSVGLRNAEENLTSRTIYDGVGNAIATIDPAGKITRTYFDALNRPTLVVENLDPEWDIQQNDAPGCNRDTTGVVDPHDICLGTVYDDEGKAIASIDPLGRVTRSFYDELGRVTNVVRNFVGNVDGTTVPTYSAVFPDQNVRTDTLYDGQGRAIATRDYYAEGGEVITNTTRSYYDDLGRVKAVVRNLSGDLYATVWPAYNTSHSDQNVRTEYVYDSLGRQIASVEVLAEDDKVTTRTYFDGLGRTASVVRNLSGQNAQDPAIPVPTSSESNLRVDRLYDATGSAIAQVEWLVEEGNALTRTTRSYYDALGRTVTLVENLTGQPVSDTEPPARNSETSDQNVRTDTAYDRAGNQVATTDPNGITTGLEYDGLGRLTAMIENYQPGLGVTQDQNVRTEYTYDEVGNRLTVNDPNGNLTATQYDDLNRPVSVTSPDQHISRTTYDAVGNVISATDTLSQTISFTYNALDQQIQVTDPLGNETHNLYNANGELVLKTDADGVATRYVYDGLGRLSDVEENYQDGISPDNQTNVHTAYTYDAAGNRLTITDGNGNVTTFTYDELNRQVSETDPLDHTWQYGYDELGNRVSMTDADENTTTYNYDDAVRLAGIDYAGSETDVSFEYDSGGRRTSMTDGTGSTSWAYDNLNRVTSITDPYQNTVGYSYDPVGNRTTLTYPGGREVDYAYDPANRLTAVTSNQSPVAGYEYDAAGRLTSITRPNGVNTTYGYDEAGRLLSILHAAGNESLASYQYSYDGVGNRTQAIENFQQTVLPPTETSDDFESGDFSAWGSAVTDGGDLSVTTAAGIQGIYGMQAEINDQNELYVTDDTPQGESVYHARFYFDPNSVDIPAGGYFDLLRGGGANGTAFTVRLGMADGDYALKTILTDDDQSTVESAWYPIQDGPHHVEIEWWTAWSSDVHDGRILLWVDDVWKGNVADQDNDTKRIDTVQWGVLSPSSAEISGTIYLDDFISRHNGDTYIGLDPNVTLPDYFQISSDAFESGDLSGWSSAETDGGDLSVTSAAAIEGSYGLQAVINDQAELFVTDTNPLEDHSYRARFYFDPNSVDIPAEDYFDLFRGTGIEGTAFILRLGKVNDDYALKLILVDDDETTDETPWEPISDRPHQIEIGWWAAWADYVPDGRTYLWVDDMWRASVDGQDNDAKRINSVQLGVLSPSSADIRGTIYLDDFISVRDGDYYIGADPNVTLPPGWQISADAFESGDFSGWSSAETNGGDLSVTSTAAIHGSYGLQAVVDGQNELFVHDNQPLNENYYDARFYFDPNSVDIPDGEGIGLFRAADIATGNVLEVRLQNVDDEYQVQAIIYDNSGDPIESSWYAITDEVHLVEVEWWAAAGPEEYDGYLGLWLDDGLMEELTDIDNDTRRVDEAEMGVLSPTSGDIAGELYFDDFSSSREGHIGPDEALTPMGTSQETRSHGAPGRRMPEPSQTPSPSRTPTPTVSPTPTRTPLPERTATPQAGLAPVSDPKDNGNPVPVRYELPASIPAAPNLETADRTIDYTYDPLGRLTAADYSDGDYYHYSYDAVGNRLSQEILVGSALTETSYEYDLANRLTNVGGVDYTWDDNGNLLDDGVITYTYNTANRLSSVVQGEESYTFTYNGVGDRLQQVANSQTTSYTLDLNAGLTQVLSDGTNTYTYGVGRIAQTNASSTKYFLGDALGSVRQLVDENAEIVLTEAYDPYGNVISRTGNGSSVYGFDAEQQDITGLIYLRARYYAPYLNQFIQPDPIVPDPRIPADWNRYTYARDNPIRFIDPTGKWVCALESYAYNRDCADWVKDALAQLKNSSHIGPKIVDFFDRRDKALKWIGFGGCLFPPLAGFGNIGGIKIAFVPNMGKAMAISPGTILLNPAYYNGPIPSGDGVVTLAHEISHLEQGNTKAFSIQGELLTAVLTYQLEDELGLPQHYIEGEDIVNTQLDPWNDIDLKILKYHFRWKGSFSIFPLRPISGDLPRDWLKQWDTNFPYNISPPASGNPTPTPVPTIPSPPLIPLP